MPDTPQNPGVSPERITARRPRRRAARRIARGQRGTTARRRTGPRPGKDKVETTRHTAVCNRKITLTAAQEAITTDWTTTLTGLGLGGS
jgi:hypothetical protein